MGRHELDEVRGAVLEVLEPRVLLAASPAATAATAATTAAVLAGTMGQQAAAAGATANLSQSAVLTVQTVPALAGNEAALGGAAPLAIRPLGAPTAPEVATLPPDLRSLVALQQATLAVAGLSAGPSASVAADISLTQVAETTPTLGTFSSLAAATSPGMAPFSDPGSLNADLRSLMATLQGA